MTHDQARTDAQTTANEIGQPVAVVEDTLRPDHPDRFAYCPAAAAATLHRSAAAAGSGPATGRAQDFDYPAEGAGCDDCEWTGTPTGRDQAAG